MQGKKATILKNALSLFGAQLITWTVALLVTVVVPRYLGPTRSGQLILGYSIWAVVVLMVEFGMDTAIVKEVARTPERTTHLFGTTMAVRLIFFAFGYCIVAVYTAFAGYSADFIQIIFLMGIAQLFWVLSSACRSILEGLESMQYTALADIITKLISMVLTISAVLLGFGLRAFVVASIITGLASLILMLSAVLRRFPRIVRTSIGSAVALLKSGLPYLLSQAALGFYGIIDIWLLSYFLDAQAVGWYGSAARLFGTVLFIPSILMTVLFPTFSRTHTTEPEKLVQIVRRSFDLLLLVSVPIGLGILVVGQPVIDLVYGSEFAPSGAILSLSGIAVIFTYLNVLLGRYMFAIDREKVWVVVMIVAAFIKIPLSLFFIPLFQDLANNGAMGSALGNVITELFMVLMGLRFIPDKTFTAGSLMMNTKTIISGILMAVAVWLFRDLFVLIPILVGVTVYTTLVLMLRIVPEEDMQLIEQLKQLVLRRFRRNAIYPT